MIRVGWLALFFSVLVANVPTHGAPPDVILSGTNYCPGILPIVVPDPVFVIEWGNLWSEVGSSSYSGITTIAAGGSGRLLALERPPENYYQFNVLEIRADQTRTQLFSMDGFAGVGLVADSAGKIYVLGARPSPLDMRIFALSPSGSLLASYPIAGTSEELSQRIDLASDQCTLFYSRDADSTLHRFNVCTGTPLPDLPAQSGGVAVLPDGDILTVGSSQLRRYDQSGSLVRTYPLGSFLFIGSFGLAAEGHHALVQIECDSPRIYEVDLDTGVVTVRAEIPTHVQGYGTGLVARNGWTAALGAAAIGNTDIPSLWTSSLAALLALLAFVGLRRLT